MCSALPMGAPSTVMPCCSGGKDWSPTHVAAPGPLHLGAGARLCSKCVSCRC